TNGGAASLVHPVRAVAREFGRDPLRRPGRSAVGRTGRAEPRRRVADDRYPRAAGGEDARQSDARRASGAGAEALRAAPAVRRSAARREAHHRALTPLMRITVLGSGTSHGVPAIGCDCAVCRSTDPKDKRTRPSILIETAADGDDRSYSRDVRSILVDTSTDLRVQALTRDVRRVDAILFTHTHADHVFG